MLYLFMTHFDGDDTTPPVVAPETPAAPEAPAAE